MTKILIGLAIILFLLTSYYIYLGGFALVKVEKQIKGPYYLVYQEMKGPYRNSGKVFEAVKSLLSEKKITPRAWAGLYFDPPAHVEESKLRTHAGALLEEKQLPEVQDLISSGKLKLRTIRSREYAVSEFPFKNQLSILIALFRVYPKLNEYGLQYSFPPFVYKEENFENEYIMEIYYPDHVEYLMTTP